MPQIGHGTIAAPWSALLGPVWVMLFYDAVARCTLSAAKGGGGSGKSESEREVAMRQYSMLQLVFTLAAAAMLGLLCLKLDGVLESWAFLFMPLFGAAAIYFCCCACCCCTLGLAPTLVAATTSVMTSSLASRRRRVPPIPTANPLEKVVAPPPRR